MVLLNQAAVPLPVVPSLLMPVLATVAGTLVADLVW